MTATSAPPPRTVHVLGVAMDYGQQRRGVSMGPQAIRYAGLHAELAAPGLAVEDLGNVTCPDRDTLPHRRPIEFLPEVARVCGEVLERGRRSLAAGAFPLFLGGDHSIAAGTVAATAAAHGEIGVLWVDAHGDFNTPETSPTGNLHGMPLAALCGLGAPELVHLGRPGAKVSPRHVVLFGARDLDAGERGLLREQGVKVITLSDIDRHGIQRAVADALAHLAPVTRLHVSLDLDVLDSVYAPGVGTPVMGGLTWREAHFLMEELHADGRAAALDLVEVNPVLDRENRTSRLAVDLAASLLGKRIF
ncbi:MAG TPA: arginase [Verrucomicrobiota bacterium]|nr:arginase [Verrucomicrobiota bacterium]